MNVAIIGCGYVGTAVAQHWRQQGLTITATTTTPARLSELESIADEVELIFGNDEDALRSLLNHQHLVLLSVGARSADAYETTYLETAKTLVNALQDNTSVKQLIYTGSYAVYGDRQGDWVDEESSVSPANRNGEILTETEQVVLNAANSHRRVCVLRLGGIYGPGRELAKIFGRVAGNTRPGDGSDISNWIHLNDIVGAIDFVRTHELQGIYNLVQTVPLTVRELIDRVCQEHNLPPVSWNPDAQSDRPYNAKVSNQKLRDAGYEFIYPEIAIASR